MPSPLQKVPYDILLNITFMSAAYSTCRPPMELLNLRLTCKTLYGYLSARNSAQIYARLFPCHFDISPLLVASCMTELNDTTLASEYVLRQQFLSRSRTSSWSKEGLTSDMWVALRMLLESREMNQKQLAAAKFPSELVKLALEHIQVSDTCGSDARGLNYLFVWLLSLMLSKADITGIPVETRERFCDILRLYVTANQPITGGPSFMMAFYDLRSKVPHLSSYGSAVSSCSDFQNCDSGMSLYRQFPIPLESMDPSLAAVNVIFAMKEACPLLIPPHLPETRALANVQQHRTSGPTMEDFREFQSYQTPLFADSLSCQGDVTRPEVSASARLGRSKSRGLELSHLYGVCEAREFEAGTFLGLWQGSYMNYTVDERGTEGYFNRRPLQVNFTEYHCYSPDIPLPSCSGASELASLSTRPWGMDHSMKRRYEKDAGTPIQERLSAEIGSQLSEVKKPRVILDTILFGETTVEHDAAWKGFRYVGRIHRDGTVYLKREPKNQSEDYLGTWIFEGRLRFGKAFVGSWRAHNSTDNQGARGIFSLAHVVDVRH